MLVLLFRTCQMRRELSATCLISVFPLKTCLPSIKFSWYFSFETKMRWESLFFLCVLSVLLLFLLKFHSVLWKGFSSFFAAVTLENNMCSGDHFVCCGFNFVVLLGIGGNGDLMRKIGWKVILLAGQRKFVFLSKLLWKILRNLII